MQWGCLLLASCVTCAPWMPAHFGINISSHKAVSDGMQRMGVHRELHPLQVVHVGSADAHGFDGDPGAAGCWPAGGMRRVRPTLLDYRRTPEPLPIVDHRPNRRKRVQLDPPHPMRASCAAPVWQRRRLFEAQVVDAVQHRRHVAALRADAGAPLA